jgi:hypothetical protein
MVVAAHGGDTAKCPPMKGTYQPCGYHACSVPDCCLSWHSRLVERAELMVITENAVIRTPGQRARRRLRGLTGEYGHQHHTPSVSVASVWYGCCWLPTMAVAADVNRTGSGPPAYVRYRRSRSRMQSRVSIANGMWELPSRGGKKIDNRDENAVYLDGGGSASPRPNTCSRFEVKCRMLLALSEPFHSMHMWRLMHAKCTNRHLRLSAAHF